MIVPLDETDWKGGYDEMDELHKNVAVVDVLAERVNQYETWGEQNHNPFVWSAILVEEVGEFCQAALHGRFGGDKADGLREEAVHVAAVALQIVECLDRGEWKW